MATNPIFICVPGAFCPSAFFDTTIAEFERQGYQAVALDLPSVGRRDGPPAEPEEDVKHIRDEIERQADKGLDVILVGNSYGAWIMGEAAKSLSKTERLDAGKLGGLVHLVYLASPFVSRTGISLPDFLAESGVAVPGDPDEQDFKVPPPAEFAGAVLFPSLPKEEQLRYGAMLEPFSNKAHHSKLSFLAFEHIPSTAVIVTKDLVVPLQWQHSVFDATVARGQGQLRKVELAGDHCCMTSHPVQTAGICIEAAKLGG